MGDQAVWRAGFCVVPAQISGHADDAGTGRRRLSHRRRRCLHEEVRLSRSGWQARPVQFRRPLRSEEHTSELQSLMRISYAVFCLKHKNNIKTKNEISNTTY